MATKRFLAKNGLDNSSLTITNVADPVNAQDAATKAFVLASASGVSSVNTRTGAVTLTSADVGLGSANNTSDTSKPISTATQTALDLKAPLANPTFTGTVTLPTSLVNVTTSSYPTVRPTLNLDFANTKQLDPRITFVRNSTAAYYDGQTTAMAEQNLLLQSENLLTSWTTINTTVTGGQTDPLGSTTAFKLVAISGGNEGAYNNGGGVFVSGTTYSISGWFKADSAVSLNIGSTAGSAGVAFSLTTVWTYFSASVAATAAGNLWIKPTSSVPIYVWHPQMEQRSSATAYTPTTTAAITNYIPQLMTAPAGVARFDCDPLTRNSLGLLIEESRTNLLTYSSDFRNTADAGTTRPWVYNEITLIPDTVIAPDGTLSMDAMVSSATGVRLPCISQSPVFTGIGTVTVYAKAGAADWFYITSLGRSPTDGAGQGIAWFNLRTGAKGAITAGFTSSILAVGNGVYRCTLVCTTSASANREARYGSSSADGLQTIAAPVGTILAFIWGAQLEAGSFATSYIPTVASTVTRAADAASMTGTNFSSWYNQAQGSLYAEADTVSSVTLTPSILSISDAFGATTNKLNLDFGSSGRFFNYTNSVNNFVLSPLTSGLTINTPFKFATSFQPNLVYAVGTGGSVKTSTAMTQMPQNIVQLRLSDNTFLNGHIRKLSYYPIALSSSNLVALTS